MKKNRKLLRRRQFSLIEIMVVLIIIGMVLGLAVPAVMGQLEKAKVKTAKNQILLLESACNSFYLENSSYPDSLQDLVNTGAGNPPYIAKGVIPKDPWGNDYQYTKTPTRDNLNVQITCYGADGQPGGEGFNADVGNWVEEEQ